MSASVQGRGGGSVGVGRCNSGRIENEFDIVIVVGVGRASVTYAGIVALFFQIVAVIRIIGFVSCVVVAAVIVVVAFAAGVAACAVTIVERLLDGRRRGVLSVVSSALGSTTVFAASVMFVAVELLLLRLLLFIAFHLLIFFHAYHCRTS